MPAVSSSSSPFAPRRCGRSFICQSARESAVSCSTIAPAARISSRVSRPSVPAHKISTRGSSLTDATTADRFTNAPTTTRRASRACCRARVPLVVVMNTRRPPTASGVYSRRRIAQIEAVDSLAAAFAAEHDLVAVRLRPPRPQRFVDLQKRHDFASPRTPAPGRSSSSPAAGRSRRPCCRPALPRRRAAANCGREIAIVHRVLRCGCNCVERVRLRIVALRS